MVRDRNNRLLGVGVGLRVRVQRNLSLVSTGAEQLYYLVGVTYYLLILYNKMLIFCALPLLHINDFLERKQKKKPYN